MKPFILGLDPSFTSFGVAVVELGRERERVERLEVLRTKPSGKKRRIRATDDNLRRLDEIARGLWGIVDQASTQGRIVAFSMECLTGSKSASTALKVGMTNALVVPIAVRLGVPVLQSTPHEVKHAATGVRPAAGNVVSKEDVRECVIAHYGSCGHLLAHLPDGEHEHGYDALAAVLASLPTDLVRGLRTAAEGP